MHRVIPRHDRSYNSDGRIFNLIMNFEWDGLPINKMFKSRGVFCVQLAGGLTRDVLRRFRVPDSLYSGFRYFSPEFAIQLSSFPELSTANSRYLLQGKEARYQAFSRVTRTSPK